MALRAHTLTLRDLQVQHPYSSQHKTTAKDPIGIPLDAARTVNVRLVPASGYEIESSGNLGAPLLRAVCTTIREWMRKCCRFGLLLQFKSTTIQRLEAGAAEVDVPINSKSCKSSWNGSRSAKSPTFFGGDTEFGSRFPPPLEGRGGLGSFSYLPHLSIAHEGNDHPRLTILACPLVPHVGRPAFAIDFHFLSLPPRSIKSYARESFKVTSTKFQLVLDVTQAIFRLEIKCLLFGIVHLSRT